MEKTGEAILSFSVEDETLDPGKARSYHLAVMENDRDFSATIFDTAARKYVATYRGPSPVDPEMLPAFPAGSLLKELHGWRSVSWSFVNERSVLIPNSLFEEERKKELLQFTHPVTEKENIHSDLLQSHKSRNLFAVLKKKEKNLRDQFPDLHFLHGSTVYLEGLMLQARNTDPRRMFANFHPGLFEVAVMEGRSLLFYNSFHYQTPEDIAYYLLFLFEQLGLNPDGEELTLSGTIEKNADEYALLFNYIRKIRFASLPEGFQFSYKFNDLPAHRYFSLLRQYPCVS